MTPQYTIGVPKETKLGEKRVALIPNHVKNIIHRVPTAKVLIETGAGVGAGHLDQEYISAGAEICSSAAELYDRANFIVKVKEPNRHDLQYINEQHILFCYFHLAAFPELTKQLLQKNVTAIAFESVTKQTSTGITLPLLEPMSVVAGQLAIHMAHDVLRSELGEMITNNSNIHIVGAGNVGRNATAVATGLGAQVTLYDVSKEKLKAYHHHSNVVGWHLDGEGDWVNEFLTEPHNRVSVVVCGALVRDDRAPHIVSRKTLETMNGEGFRPTVFVDVSIDQGGCIEGIRSTNLRDTWYKQGKNYFIAVPNMPGSVPHTSSSMLSFAISPYVSLLVDLVNLDELVHNEQQMTMFDSLNDGIVIKRGKITNPTLIKLYGEQGELIP